MDTELTCNVFGGGSKRSRHSAPKGISEETWADMSRQQHNDCRALHAEFANRKAATPAAPETKKARADDALSAESETGAANVTVEIPYPSNWDSFTPSQEFH